jgi:hypothetical protein
LRIFPATLALLSGLVMCALGTAPASAATGSFTSPAAGSTYRAGDQVTFAVSGLSQWQVEIYCENDETTYWDTADSTGPYVVASNGTTAELTCTADLYDASWSWQDDVVYHVVPEPRANEVRNVAASPDVFYPRVRDRYRDAVDLGLTVRANATVTMTVRNADGRTVRTRRVQGGGGDWNTSYQRTWSDWNGRNNQGNLVPVGRYRVTFTSQAEGYRTARATVTVHVATGWRTVRRTKTADPWYGSRDSVRGNCFISESSYPYGNTLDCWGGAYAQATYRLRIPTNARVTGWYAGGERGCCDNGRVIKTGKRIAPGRFEIRVRVTNWASFTVTRVGVSYRFRARI